MQLSAFKIFSIKLAIFSTVLAYLALDLWCIHGPVWQALHGNGAPALAPEEIEAEVYGEKISKQQLDRYEEEQNWLTGRPAGDHSRRNSLRMNLVQETLLRIRTRYNDKNLPDCRAAAEEEYARLASRAKDEALFEGWLRSQGFSKLDYIRKIESRLRGLALLERAIAPYCRVTDEAVEEHYKELKNSLVRPAERRVQQIFLYTQGRKPEEVKQKAEALMAELQSGASFEALATKASEDEASAAKGGDLGIIYDDYRRCLPALPLFGDEAIPAGVPQLRQSKWGWHILLAGPISPAREIALEECRESLRSALESAQRELAVNAYFRAAIDEGLQQKKIKFHVK